MRPSALQGRGASWAGTTSEPAGRLTLSVVRAVALLGGRRCLATPSPPAIPWCALSQHSDPCSNVSKVVCPPHHCAAPSFSSCPKPLRIRVSGRYFPRCAASSGKGRGASTATTFLTSGGLDERVSRGGGTSSLCLLFSTCPEPLPQAAWASSSRSRRPAIPVELALPQLRALRGWGS